MLERAQITERIRHTMAAGRRKGKWMGGRVPLGYDLLPARQGAGKLIPNHEEAAQVRAAFERYDRTGSLLETARFMNELGWRTKKWHNRRDEEQGWLRYDKTRISALLRMRLYRGEIEYKGDIIRGEHEALVSPALWDRVNGRLARQRRHRTIKPRAAEADAALLQGMVYCHACGRAMTHIRTGNSTGKRYRYYTCTTAIKGGFADCPTKSVPAAELEAFVVRQLRSIADDAAFRAALVERAQTTHGEEKARLEAEVKSLLTTAASLDRRIRTETGVVDQALFDEHAAARVRLEQLQGDLALHPPPPTAPELLATAEQFAPVWGELTADEQRRLVTLLIEKVSVDGENRRVAVKFVPAGFRRLGEAEAARTA